MRRHAVLAHIHRRTQPARHVTRSAIISCTTFSRIIVRPIVRSTVQSIVRSNLVLPRPQRSPIAVPSSVPTGFQPDPYLDYGRFLTAEGGVLIIYKDLDEAFRHTLWRFFAWTSFTMTEGTFLYDRSPLHSSWINIACFVAAALINWLVVRPPVEIYRNIEIRPDCLIIDGQEIFWLRFMENWPSFRPGKDGSQGLCGIYGTRFVEFLTVRPFDEFDRTPEIFAAHLQDAMKQLWTGLH